MYIYPDNQTDYPDRLNIHTYQCKGSTCRKPHARQDNIYATNDNDHDNDSETRTGTKREMTLINDTGDSLI